MPVIIDLPTAQGVANRRTKAKTHPARHLKNDYLGLGITYCEVCKVKMLAQTQDRYSRNQLRKSPIRRYRCTYSNSQYGMPNCAKRIGAKKLDTLLWEKVWLFVSDDERFEQELHKKIVALQQIETDANTEFDRLQRTLGNLDLERQQIITWARKRSITEEDREKQLGELLLQETELKRDLSQVNLLVGDRAQRLMEFANRFRAETRAGLEWVNTPPQTPEEARKQFLIKREIVENIVT